MSDHSDMKNDDMKNDDMKNDDMIMVLSIMFRV